MEGYLFHLRPLRVLLFQRPPERGAIWVPVSGKVEPADPDFASAIRREIREETGFLEFERVFPLEWDVVFAGPDCRPWRLHAFGVELRRPDIPRLSPEHDGFAWLDPAQAVRRLHYEDNQAAVRKLLSLLGVLDPQRPSANL